LDVRILGRNWMKFRFNRIPELEYKIIFDHCLCSEAVITEDGINCELLGKKKFEKQLKQMVTKAFSVEKHLLKTLNDLLMQRENVLQIMSQYAPRIYPFSEEEIEVETETGAKEESEEISKEMPLEDLGEELYEEERCIEVIARNTKVFEESIEAYLKTYTKICDLLLNSSIKSRDHALELISQLANLDTIAIKKYGLYGSILIPLDFSPQRLAFALNSQAALDETRSDRFYIPPIMARRLDGKNTVFHAYRSVDDYPVLFPAIHMEEREIGKEREERFHQEITDATKILYKLKRGRRGARFPLSELSQIIEIYLDEFPPARDRLAIVDLGVGRGGVLKAVVNRFITDHATTLIDERAAWLIVLNDVYEEERTGEEFVRYASTDKASQLVREVRKIIGDIGKAANLLKDFDADICFINRVLDMYARYGFYSVDVKEQNNCPLSAAVNQEEDTEHRGTLLVYKNLIRFKGLYNLQRQLLRHEELRKRTVLPGISYNLKNDFFEPKAFSLETLVTMSKLVVISIFPATKQTLFANLLSPGIYIYPIGERDLSTRPRYIVFCLSKGKKMIETIGKHFDGVQVLGD
jgi:hypothetical protein